MRWNISIRSPEDLAIRVVRSTSGIIQIPELGVTIEPGPACEGFVSNVEGVLWRVMEAIGRVLSWAEGEDRTRAQALQKTVRQALEGEVPFTLILEDPCGNSAIVSDQAIRETYRPPNEPEDADGPQS